MPVVRALLAAFAMGAFVFVPACSTGPAKGNSGFFVAQGTCSGTPIACGGLSGAVCPLVTGCQDFGTCIGTASTTGEACGARTAFTSCSGTSGCFWQANCSGQPFGTCSGITEQQCEAIPGCVWTPYLSSMSPREAGR